MNANALHLNETVRLSDGSLARLDATPVMVRACSRLYGYQGGMVAPVVVDLGGEFTIVEAASIRSAFRHAVNVLGDVTVWESAV